MKCLDPQFSSVTQSCLTLCDPMNREYARSHERLGISPKVPLSLPFSVQGRFIPPLTSRGSVPILQPTQCPTTRASAFLASVRDRSCLESYYLEL